MAELFPPNTTASGEKRAYWDFSLIDPITDAFFAATAGHDIVFNFATIPQWLFEGPHSAVPDDANQRDTAYEAGTVLRDASLGELKGYYSRLAEYYFKGSMVDEAGNVHKRSASHPRPPCPAYWEVNNEVDFEYHTTSADYIQRYGMVANTHTR